MDVLVERCAGLDVHKDTVVACVRTPGKGGRRDRVTRTFGTMTADLLALRDWLIAMGVTLVGMESTGVYWKPVFYVLEDAMECWLLNARHLRNVPGRKTDVADAEWICQLVEHGLVRPSFVPPKPIRELRDLTRYRKAQIDERGREAQRLDKVLQDAGIKLSSVATDILGKSGRDMLVALISGTRDPQVLAELARGRLRTKIPLLRRALEGRFVSHHRLIVEKILTKLDFLDETIDDLSAEIDRLIAPFAAEVELLDTITGVDRRAAECMVAEIGVDMARFGTSARLASWAGRCPGNHESAGKHKSGKSRPGSKWLAATLAQCAEAAGRSKGTYLGAQFQRLRGRRGHAKARKAVEHSILVAAYHILDQHVPYQDLGADWFQRRRPEVHARRLAHQIEALGFPRHPRTRRLTRRAYGPEPGSAALRRVPSACPLTFVFGSGFYLITAKAAARHLRPLSESADPERFEGHDDALAWSYHERADLVAAMHKAATTDRHDQTSDLASMLGRQVAGSETGLEPDRGPSPRRQSAGSPARCRTLPVTTRWCIS